MAFFHCTFSLSVIFIGIAGQPLLRLIGSNVTLVTEWIWIAMAFAWFFDRYGALHLQFYSITNDIIWHIANGITGILFISFSFIFASIMKMGVISFPIALIISDLVFFCWYAAKIIYLIDFRVLNTGQHLSVIIAAFTCFQIYSLSVIMIKLQRHTEFLPERSITVNGSRQSSAA